MYRSIPLIRRGVYIQTKGKFDGSISVGLIHGGEGGLYAEEKALQFAIC